MALHEIKVVVIDLDTVLTGGLKDVYESIEKCFKKRPHLWVWIPEDFSGFYANKNLTSMKGVDYFVCGKLDIGDFFPHQVLLYSRSVHTLLPIREKKVCQTIIGDSLAVLDQYKNKFSNQFRFEFSEPQRQFLVNRRQSKIYRYLKTDCGIDELNRGMWIQERCEGVAILTKMNALVAISKVALAEWEAIFKQELQWVPETNSGGMPPSPSAQMKSPMSATAMENYQGEPNFSKTSDNKRGFGIDPRSGSDRSNRESTLTAGGTVGTKSNREDSLATSTKEQQQQQNLNDQEKDSDQVILHGPPGSGQNQQRGHILPKIDPFGRRGGGGGGKGGDSSPGPGSPISERERGERESKKSIKTNKTQTVEEAQLERAIRESMKVKSKEDAELQKAIRSSLKEADPDRLAAAVRENIEAESLKKLADRNIDVVD